MNPAIGVIFVLIAGFVFVTFLPVINESVESVQNDDSIDEGTQTFSGLLPLGIFISLLLVLFAVISMRGSG